MVILPYNQIGFLVNASATEQLLVRIDDKLNRIMKGAGLLATDEDVVNDLIGYLVLLKISMESDKQNEILDISNINLW